jgi:hypothetical protein
VNLSTPQWLETGLLWKLCVFMRKKNDRQPEGEKIVTAYPMPYMLWPELLDYSAFVAYLDGNLLIPLRDDPTTRKRVPAPTLDELNAAITAWENAPPTNGSVDNDDTNRAFDALQKRTAYLQRCDDTQVCFADRYAVIVLLFKFHLFIEHILFDTRFRRSLNPSNHPTMWLLIVHYIHTGAVTSCTMQQPS